MSLLVEHPICSRQIVDLVLTYSLRYVIHPGPEGLKKQHGHTCYFIPFLRSYIYMKL